jgi:diguanylate cyclase (GGDEF)-like protein/PAS domain S-box-containing protein
MAEVASEPDGPVVAMTRDAAGLVTGVDESVVELLGWRPEQLVGQPSTRLIHPEDQGSAVGAWMDMITNPGESRTWRGRYQDAEGRWVWVESVNRCEPDGQTVQSTMRRVSMEQVGIEEELRAREELLSRLSDALPVGIFQFDRSGTIVFTNDQLFEILGTPPAARIDGPFATVVAEDRALLACAAAATLTGERAADLELRLDVPRADGVPSERVCVVSLRPLTDATGGIVGAVGCVDDVTDRVLLRRELEVRASIDALTGCLNRDTVLRMLEAELAISHVDGTAVVFVDLDRFKSVNDRFGHVTGDLFLRCAAQRIHTAIRQQDRVGRFGGDEFLVLCPGVTDERHAQRIARRIRLALDGPTDLGGTTVDLHASVGYAWSHEPIAADALIERADALMYAKKQAERTRESIAATPLVSAR